MMIRAATRRPVRQPATPTTGGRARRRERRAGPRKRATATACEPWYPSGQTSMTKSPGTARPVRGGPAWIRHGRPVGRPHSLQRRIPTSSLTHIFNRHVARKRVDWVPVVRCTWTEIGRRRPDADVDIVIELVGGLRPAYDWVQAARCMAGKSVVTANKQLMAHHGTELLDLARARGLEVRFEASVAGGIPVLRALQEGLAGDRLVEVRGILNGTCDYILSRMQSEPISFADALAEAQRPATPKPIRPKTSTAPTPPPSSRSSPPSACAGRCASPTSRRGRSGRSSRSTSSTRASSAARSARSRARRPRTTARCSPPSGRRSCRSSSNFGRDRRQPEPRDRARRVRRRDVVLRVRAPADRRRPSPSSPTCCRSRRAGGEPAPRRGADRVPPGQRRLRRAALRALHRERQARASSPQVTAAYARYGINIEGVLQLPKFRKDRLPFVTTLEECSGVGARPGARRSRAERLPRPAAAGAADLRADMRRRPPRLHSARSSRPKGT